MFVDYLTAYFETGDTLYRDLYVGEKLKQCYSPTDTPDEAIERRRKITSLDQNCVFEFRPPQILNRESSAVLEAELVSLRDLCTRTGDKLEVACSW